MASKQTEILDIVSATTAVQRASLLPETRIADLKLDSIDIIEIIFAIEEKYRIDIPWSPNDSETRLETVGDVIAAVEKAIADSGARG